MAKHSGSSSVPGLRPIATFDTAWATAKELAAKFAANENHYASGAYQEAHLRTEFLNKLLIGLGWDVLHDHEHDPYRQEVKIERPDQRATGRADYAFSLAPTYQRVRFLLEAKRPQHDILTPDNCFQAIRYSWPLGLPIVILSDFRSLHVIDSRFKPNINSATSRAIRSWKYSDFSDHDAFSEVYWLISREAVSEGSIDRFASEHLPSQVAATKQYSLFPADTRDFDDDFLSSLDDWRTQLATAFRAARRKLTGAQLTEVVQRTLDRLVFVRFLEDKEIEPDPVISKFGTGKKPAWRDFIQASRRLDATYNGIVFKPHPIIDDPEFNPSSKAFLEICDDLTDDHSPYHFGSIPVEILGRIYERFLGRVVEIEGNTARVVDKEDVRRAGGVYYTPSYIVDYMVDAALGPIVQDAATVESILKIRVADTSCGSGSFLIAAFAYLMASMVAVLRDASAKVKKGRCEEREGEIHLTMAFKREVLTKCIYGVDIDAQAVEVAQLSLYLKLMEDETTYSAHSQQIEMGGALLPSLAANIVEGNTLVTLDEDLFSADELRSSKSIDLQQTFPLAFRQGGFDLIIGNPPYIKEPTNRSAFDNLRNSPYYEGKMDLWYMFAAKGLDWLKPKSGTLALIATNNWTTNSGAKKLRAKLAADATIQQLIDFGDYKVFRDAGIQTMILIARRDNSAESYKFDYRRIVSPRAERVGVQMMLEAQASSAAQLLSPTISRCANPTAPLTFSDQPSTDLLVRIEQAGNFSLDPRTELTQGIVPNPDVVSARSLALIPASRRQHEKISVGDGVFVVPKGTFRNPTKEELKFLKPLIEPTEVCRYYVRSPSRSFLIYSVRNPHRDDLPPPRLREHLYKFREIMSVRRETLNGRIATYHLHWPRSEKFFAPGGKILSVRKCRTPTFAYTEDSAYVMMAFNVIKTDRVNMKYLTALLNSDVIKFWLRNKGKMQGYNYQVDSEPLLAIPLHVPDTAEQARIAALMERVVDRSRSLITAQTSAETERAERLLAQSEEAVQAAIGALYGFDEASRDAISRSVRVSEA